ncbi:MAG: PA domain-containing protein [Thermoanaerobaculia bacterium]
MKTISRFLFLSLVILLAATPAFAGANIFVVNGDGANEGFNDPTPAAPVGGNPGTTKGQQRLIAFTHAADIWANTLDSNVDIWVLAAFNPLGANVLGSAGAAYRVRDFSGVPPFPGALYPASWYSGALADKRAGVDFAPDLFDITAQFSSDFNFYLGLDNNHGAQNDLVAVLLHELGHGLGFQNFVNEQTGANQSGFTDVYSQFTLDITNNTIWSNMIDAQRAASATRWGSVVWTGAEVTAGAPSVLLPGSSELRVLSPSSIARSYQFGTATFGTPINSPGITASVVAAVDASTVDGPATTDGCTAFTNAAAVSGKIALIERGTCGFTIKVKNAQNAGAIGAIIYNNLANAAAAPSNMATDPVVGPTITITSVSINRPDGLAIVSQLGSGVTASIAQDLSVLAGADANGRVRLYAPFPVALGSSISHFDTPANRNLLMEPFINADLTHSLTPPNDLTLPLMRDIGWFPDADVDGIADGDDNCPTVANADQTNYDGDSEGDVCDADDDNDGVADGSDVLPHSDIRPSVTIGACNSGAANGVAFSNGETVQDRINALMATNPNHGQLVAAVNQILQDAEAAGLITKDGSKAIRDCAAHN